MRCIHFKITSHSCFKPTNNQHVRLKKRDTYYFHYFLLMFLIYTLKRKFLIVKGNTFADISSQPNISSIYIVISTGLLKGSVTAERPRTLRRLRNVYGPSACGMGTGGDGGGGGERLEDGEVSFRLSDRDRERDEKSLSIMSPFDEQEEWAKISEIMASIGTGLVRESVFVTELEKEFQTRLGIYAI